MSEEITYGPWKNNDPETKGSYSYRNDEHQTSTNGDGHATASEEREHETRINMCDSEKKEDNVPDATFLKAKRRDQYLDVCVPLYRAALQGNWKAAKDVIDKYPDANAIRIAITEKLETTLHIAAAAKHTSFVKELVKRMNENDLALKNEHGYTAMCFAAVSGVVKIAETMVRKNENLPLIRGDRGKVTPLYLAVKLGHKNMVWYLRKVTKVEQLSRQEKIDLLFASISTDMFDVALELLQKDRTLATARNSEKETELQDTALHVLARKPQVFPRETLLVSMGRFISSYTALHVFGSMGRFISSWIHKKRTSTTVLAQELAQNLWRQVVEDRSMCEMSELIERPSNFLLDAAAIGNVGFLTLLLRSYPDLLWSFDKERGTIFHVAVVQRQESVFSLIFDIGAIKDLVTCAPVENKTNPEDGKNSMLHLAAILPPQSRLNVVSGAALQMQRELLWFQEVQKIVPPVCLSLGGPKDREIPRVQFTKNHQELMKEAEKWMKDTATSCMIVATLIATVVFTAAFTVPGGNNSETGRPVLLQEQWFVVFVLSDMFGLFSSVISIVIFLSILTSRYAEEDFLVSLPAKLIVGLAALFLSIASMLLAFVATFFLVYDFAMSLVPIFVASFAYLVAISHFVLHLKVWIDMIISTFFSRFVFTNCRNKLF